jgi:hypothetical protein
MTNTDIFANTKTETRRDLELTPDELEAVSGGGKASGGNLAGTMFLKFTFKLVAVKTI